MKIKIKNTTTSISLWWNISKICNYNCPYCNQRSTTITPFDKDEATRVANQLKKLFNSSKYKRIDMIITGGEPALYDLPEIVNILSGDDYKLKININTNFSLHDIDWWNSLKNDNIILNINASCHLSQLNNLDEWLDKASHMTNVDKFKVKFVITNDNFEEVKLAVNKCIEKNIHFCLEGARGKNQVALFNDEIKEYIANSNSIYELSSNAMYNYNDGKCTHTELLWNVHNKNINSVKCIKRIAIRGNMVESGCPNKIEKKSIYDLTNLDWTTINDCKFLNICNMCQIGEIEFNEENI